MEMKPDIDRPRVSIVVAIGRDKQHNHVIGKDNELLWKIPDDLKRFRQITLGHPVVMGRKTFESIVAVRGGGLPGRPNIVITRDTAWSHPDAIVVHSIDEGLKKAAELDSEEIFLGGGTEIYNQALSQVDRLYLTIIDDEKEGDAYFPSYENDFTKKLLEEEREWNGIRYRWIDLERA